MPGLWEPTTAPDPAPSPVPVLREPLHLDPESPGHCHTIRRHPQFSPSKRPRPCPRSLRGPYVTARLSPFAGLYLKLWSFRPAGNSPTRPPNPSNQSRLNRSGSAPVPHLDQSEYSYGLQLSACSHIFRAPFIGRAAGAGHCGTRSLDLACFS